MPGHLDEQLTKDARMRHSHRSECPIACTLDIIGDKWTLLVIRDLLYANKKRYGEFAASSEKIPTNILSDRLKRLESHGIIERRLYTQHPPRAEYHLTNKGTELARVVKALYDWGQAHCECISTPPSSD